MFRFKRPDQQLVQQHIEPVNCQWPTVTIKGEVWNVDQPRLFIVVAVFGLIVASILGIAHGILHGAETLETGYVLGSFVTSAIVILAISLRFAQYWLQGALLVLTEFEPFELAPHPGQIVAQFFIGLLHFLVFALATAITSGVMGLTGSGTVIVTTIIGVAVLAGVGVLIRWRNQQRLIIMSNLRG